jgi:uncharacterized protein YgfB (UPF0149 family)
VDFEREKLFEEKYPDLYRLLSAFAGGAEEGLSDWDVVRREVTDCETATKLLEQVQAFLKEKPMDFEHVVEDIANYYFEDTDAFVEWMERIKRYLSSVKGRLCG